MLLARTCSLWRYRFSVGRIVFENVYRVNNFIKCKVLYIAPDNISNGCIWQIIESHLRPLLRVPGAMCGSQNMSLIDEGAAAPELASLAAVQVDCGHPRPRARFGLRPTYYAATFIFTLPTLCPNNYKALRSQSAVHKVLLSKLLSRQA